VKQTLFMIKKDKPEVNAHSGPTTENSTFKNIMNSLMPQQQANIESKKTSQSIQADYSGSVKDF